MPYSLSNRIEWCKILQYASVLLDGSKYWLSVQVKYKSGSSSISVRERDERRFAPSLLVEHSTVIIFASGRSGREALERGREAVAKRAGKRAAGETGGEGRLSPTKCNCLQRQRGKRSEKGNGSVTAIVLKINVRFPPRFRQVSSQLSHLSYLQYLQDFHINFI